jgi:hypothetical protein
MGGSPFWVVGFAVLERIGLNDFEDEDHPLILGYRTQRERLRS